MDNVFLLIISFVFVISFALQLYFYLFIYLRVALFNSISEPTKNIPVSIIIAAKNEYKNLKKNLDAVLKQDYPDFEVVLVNDGSTDNSADIILKLKAKYSNLKLIDLKKSSGKKYALTKGIEASMHNHLLFIDADCKPVSPSWISLMTSCFDEKTDIVLGYGAYEMDKGLLKTFVWYDSFFIALQYFGAALTGNPYMGVGRNLAYKKEVWKKHGGFEAHKNIVSGDDDLFIISAANKTNIRIMSNAKAKTVSIAAATFGEFCRQKSRHFSATKKYKLKNLFFAGGELVTRSLFYLCFFVLTFSGFFPLGLLLLAIRLVVQIYVIDNYALKINEKNHFYNWILFDIFAIIIYVILLFYKLLVSKNN